MTPHRRAKKKTQPKPVIEELLDGACASLHSSLTLAAVAFATIPTTELFKKGLARFLTLAGKVTN